MAEHTAVTVLAWIGALWLACVFVVAVAAVYFSRRSCPQELHLAGRRTEVAPHEWARKGWRLWICRHCYAPKSLHPRTGWGPARPLHDTTYLSARAPHFEEGW